MPIFVLHYNNETSLMCFSLTFKHGLVGSTSIAYMQTITGTLLGGNHLGRNKVQNYN